MKKILPLLFLMFGCASAKIVSWNGNQYTVCGNVLADDDTYRETIAKKCDNYRVVGGGTMATGHSIITPGNAYGMPAQAHAQTQECRVYECGN